MGRELTAPSERLVAAAQLAAARFFLKEDLENLSAIDVGCDHAKLAVYLVQSGICKSVLACDVADGPVAKARDTISRRKFHDKPLTDFITVKKNDGLQNLDASNANRIFILGMGGELIADILEKARFVKENTRKIGFVLQAMTSEHVLRRYLAENGFTICCEQLVRDKGRIYSLIACRFDGQIHTFTEAEYTVGTYHARFPHQELFLPYIDRKIRIAAKVLANQTAAGMNVQEAETLFNDLKCLREQGFNNLQAPKEMLS